MGTAANTPDGYVVYGTALWDAPWLTEHNLALALAKHHRVLYVEPPVTPLTPLRRRHDPAAARAELRALLRRGVRGDGQLRVFRPLALPPLEHERMRALSAPIVRRQLRRAAAKLGLERPAVVAAREMLQLGGALNESARVYLVKDLVGAGSSFLGLDAERLAADEAAMCRSADVVCATSAALRDSLAAQGIEAVHLPHGFHADLAPAYDSAPSPAEYANLSRPLLGYTGRIDARLDFGLLAALADELPQASLVLIGPVSPRLPRAELDELLRRPNAHLLGPRRRERLPGYLAHLDCCLIPYRDIEWNHHASPLKLWDYLYAGAPIVGSASRALRDFPPPLVAFAEDGPGFVRAVKEALANPREGREQRRRFARENSWDRRAGQLEEIVEQAAGRRSAPAGRKLTRPADVLRA